MEDQRDVLQNFSGGALSSSRVLPLSHRLTVPWVLGNQSEHCELTAVGKIRAPIPPRHVDPVFRMDRIDILAAHKGPFGTLPPRHPRFSRTRSKPCLPLTLVCARRQPRPVTSIAVPSRCGRPVTRQKVADPSGLRAVRDRDGAAMPSDHAIRYPDALHDSTCTATGRLRPRSAKGEVARKEVARIISAAPAGARSFPAAEANCASCHQNWKRRSRRSSV